MTDKPRLIEWAKSLADDLMKDGARLVQMGVEIEQQAQVYSSLLKLVDECNDGTTREAILRHTSRERRHLQDLMQQAREFRARAR